MNEHTEETWERSALREIALEGIKERRRARRWGIFFKLLLLGYLFALLFMASSCSETLWREAAGPAGSHTGVVDVSGVIAPDSAASAERIIRGLEEAFAATGTAAVVLRINSPGGSPVQAGRVYHAMKRLRQQHPDTPLYAVAEDSCASGAYYIAAAAERIYADQASIIGSIGVVMRGFGFTQGMQRLGVQRRLYTAGKYKGILDPFQPVVPKERQHLQGMLDGIHEQFITAVREGRGERLKEDKAPLFSGLFWTGRRSQALGLVDGLASVDEVAREVVGSPDLVNYTPQRPLLERVAQRVGAAAAASLRSLVTLPNGMR